MSKLPEKRIEGSVRKSLIPLVLLWIILFPLICLLIYLIIYGLNRGEDIPSIMIVNLILMAFLFGITYLTMRQRHSLVLNQTGVKFIKRETVKNINWSDVSHIGTGSYKGTHFVKLYMKEWQQKKESLQGLEKWILILKELWIPKSFVPIPSKFLNIAHKKLLSLVETYFERATSQT